MPEVHELYAETWESFDTEATMSSERTIEEALDRAREISYGNNDIEALIPESLFLVSGAICLLEPDDHISLSM